MNRRGFLVGFLAGGWLATALLLLVAHLGAPQAKAEDPPTTGTGPNTPPPAGPTVNPIDPGPQPRGLANPGAGTADSNNRSIALSASIGGGESVVYYFDTVDQRLCIYQYRGGSRGGLRLLAARRIEWDLKLERYRDLSEKSPREMRELYEEAMGEEEARPGGMPTRRVELPGGFR